MPRPKCKVHGTPLCCIQCIGQRGGSVSNPKKAAAARRNGRKGGRPPKDKAAA